MKLELTLSFVPFQYKIPIIVQSHTLIENVLLSVSIFHKKNFLSKIELTSLPKFHMYDLTEWKFILENFFQENDFNLENIKLDQAFFNMISPLSNELFEGELLYVIESVLFKVIEVCKPEVLSFIDKKPIKTNGLFSQGLKMDSLPECLKIKIRPTTKNLLETSDLLNKLFKLNPKIFFRFDGNQSFDLNELLSYFQQLQKNCELPLVKLIEYIEEPFKNASESHLFHQYFKIPIAIDESLIIYKENLNLLPKKTNLILKPSLFGISKSFKILGLAKKLQLKIVISSSYETSSAISPLLYLAALSPDTYHGFDTLKFLPKDLSIESENYSLTF